jgi:hypothetical protein
MRWLAYRDDAMLDVVNWDQWFVDLLDLALNESRVCGLQYDAEAAEARLRLEVLALPETGRPILIHDGSSCCPACPPLR